MQADRRPPSAFSLIAVFILALAIRGGIAWSTGFDGLYGQDAYAFSEGGEQIARTHRYTGLQSVGYPALVGLGYAVFGAGPLVAQSIGILLGAVTAVITAGLGWHLTRRRETAWIAGLMVGLLPASVRWSLTVMSDVPALFWLTGGVACGVRYVQTRSWPWGTGMTVLLAVAAATRYVSVLAGIPILAYAAVSGFRPPRTHLLAGGLLGLLILIPEIRHMQTIHIQSVYMLQEWSPLNAFRRAFVTRADGPLQYDWPVSIMYAKTLAGWGFFNPVFAGFAMAGAVAFRTDRVALAVLMSWILGFYGVLTGIPVVNPRYLLPVVVPMSLLCAIGLAETGRWVMRRTFAHRVVAGVVACAGLSGMGWGMYRSVGETLARKTCELEMVAWVERRIPEDALIIAFDAAHAVKRYTDRRVVHLHEVEPARLPVPGGTEPGVYLIWNEPLARRVAKHTPDPDDPIPRFAENYAWLRDRARLTPLGRVCGWEVARVNR